MKIYSKVVIDMGSMETVHEEFREYSGPLAMCGGGGGGAGVTDYPLYLKTVHENWLHSADAGAAINQPIAQYMDLYLTDPKNPYISYGRLLSTVDAQPYNPTPQASEVSGGHADMRTAAESITPDTVFDSAVAKALNVLTSYNVLQEDSLLEAISTIVTASTSYAGSQITNALSAARLANATNVNDVVYSNVEDDVEDALELAISEAGTALSTLFTTIQSRLQTPIDNIVSAALSKATAVLSSTPISDVVAAFESSQAIRFAAEKSRFLGSMADVNSVNSSAFAFGLALLEAERAQAVDRVEADLKLQTHKDVYASYIQTFQAALQGYLQTYLVEITEFMKGINTNIPTYTQIYRDVLHYHTTTYLESFRDRLSVFMQEKMRYNTDRDIFVREGVKDVINLTQTRLQGRLTAGHSRMEAGRLKYVMYSEERDKSIANVALAYKWPQEIYQSGANMLASIAGAAVITAGNQPTRAQSVLGGAASGAGIGLKLGAEVGTAIGGPPGTAIGGPIGAGIGAIVGAISGAQ